MVPDCFGTQMGQTRVQWLEWNMEEHGPKSSKICVFFGKEVAFACVTHAGGFGMIEIGLWRLEIRKVVELQKEKIWSPRCFSSMVFHVIIQHSGIQGL